MSRRRPTPVGYWAAEHPYGFALMVAGGGVVAGVAGRVHPMRVAVVCVVAAAVTAAVWAPSSSPVRAWVRGEGSFVVAVCLGVGLPLAVVIGTLAIL